MKAQDRLLRITRFGRFPYAAWGICLSLLKYNIDRFLAASYGQKSWTPLSYLGPAGGSTFGEVAADDRAFFLALALTSIPFALAGLMLTAGRLRSAGWSLWLLFLFFVPAINLVFFAVLCWAPPAEEQPPAEPGTSQEFLRRILPHGRLATAAAATLLTSILTAFLAWLSVNRLGSYGWALFFALPFASGLLAVLLASARGQCSFGESLVLSLLTVAVAGILLFAFAVEGLICLLMALPIAVVMALAGGTIAFLIQAQVWKYRQGTAVLCTILAAFPVTFVFDEKLQPPLRRCDTELRIAASPERVWDHVIQFSRIPPPEEWVFKTGIAYPVEAAIEGHGIGAIRRCRFSTGDFVEPITSWQKPIRLAFSVQSMPEPMQELSPYRNLKPAHLNAYLVSERGEFLLEPLPDGGTLLRGTTWYRQHLWPQFYWTRFTDFLIHSIHLRVLKHIRSEAESGI